MYRSFLAPGCAVAAAVLSCSEALAQQFVHQSGLLSTKTWTEGVEPADVDNDGDIDLFFADGDGFGSPGTKLQNRLIINRLEISANNWVDESVARLGVNKSIAKMVVSGDINGDGYLDALFCNAFDTDPCNLYVNRATQNPGAFIQDNVARGLGGVYSSASAMFGDLDNDGDLDLILADSGSNYFGNPGGVPHLFLNDGNGYFTEAAAQLNAPTKKAQMDVQLVDIDGDYDLDFFGPNRSSNSSGYHYLMLNDGAGNFTDVSSSVPNTSTSVYEAEVGDLDGDNDMDMFFVSLSGFAEGAMRNNLNGGGTLTFTAGSTTGSSDDNEIALYDFDNDGDYDVVVGSLGSSEKLLRNNGSLSFSSVSSDFTSVSDSTLDLTVADIDNDGDYDVITAQGESNSSQFDNKIYKNSGPADTVAPVIVRMESLPALPPANGPWVVRAQVRDQVMDDGNDWVSASVLYRVDTAGGPGAWTPGDATRMAGGLWRFRMDDVAEGLGTTLAYRLTFTDYAGNSTQSALQTAPLGLVCGFAPYGMTVGGDNILTIVPSGSTAPGGSFTMTVEAPGYFSILFGLAYGRASLPFFGGTALINPFTFQGLIPVLVSGGSASNTWAIPANPSLVGVRANVQAFSRDQSLLGGWALTNAVEVGICF